MPDLSINNTVTVSVAQAPLGLNTPDINNIAIFTHESHASWDGQNYQIYEDPTSAFQDFGTTSITGQMVNNILSQSPNPLNADGQVIVIPFLPSTIGATNTYYENSHNIYPNLASLTAVENGVVQYDLNGQGVQAISGIVLSNANTFSDILNVIQNTIPDVTVDLSITAATSSTSASASFAYTLREVGSTSSLVFSAYSGSATGVTDLSSSHLLDLLAISITAGQNSSGESLPEAIVRTQNKLHYCGVLSTLQYESNAQISNAKFIQGQDMILINPTNSIADLLTTHEEIMNASDNNTRNTLYNSGNTINGAGTPIITPQLTAAAAAGVMFSVNFNGTNTFQTMNLKTLVNVDPDLNLTQDIYNIAEQVGTDLYVSEGGLSCYASNGSNNYFDQVYAKLWLKLNLQVAGFNVLKTTSTGIPQTESGMQTLKAGYKQVLQQALACGILATGIPWSGPITFGDPVNFQNCIQKVGYYMYYIPIALQSEAQRIARQAPLMQIAVKFAGFDHSSDVLVVAEA